MTEGVGFITYLVLSPRFVNIKRKGHECTPDFYVAVAPMTAEGLVFSDGGPLRTELQRGTAFTIPQPKTRRESGRGCFCLSEPPGRPQREMDRLSGQCGRLPRPVRRTCSRAPSVGVFPWNTET